MLTMTTNQIWEFGKTPHSAADLLDHPCFSHTRVSDFCCPNRDTIWVYFRCSDSPSGVLLAGSFKLNPENEAALRARKIRANTGPSRGDIAARNLCGTVSF